MNDVRPLLFEAAAAFRAVVAGIEPDDWDKPGLGEWNVRELCGHTMRALVTAREYAEHPSDDPTPTLPNIGVYFHNALSIPDINQAIAQRGRDAGVALGDDPLSAVEAGISAATAVIESADLDAVVNVAGGTMVFRQYLRTRLFELVIHTDDLCRALAIDPPFSEAVLREVMSVTTEVANTAALVDLLRGATGRVALPTGFSVLG